MQMPTRGNGGEKVDRRLTAILAADIAGNSALMGSDQARTAHDLKEHQAAVLPMIGEFGGCIIDTAGDGILADFASVVNALQCAVAVQRKMAARTPQSSRTGAYSSAWALISVTSSTTTLASMAIA